MLVDEAEGMCLGGVHAHKGYNTHGLTVKEDGYMNLVVVPL